MGKVVVVGSLNVDIVAETPRLPVVGETLLGGDIAYFVGGKGCNQAVAAARYGAKVAMVGKLGKDQFSQQVKAQLTTEGIEQSAVTQVADKATGIATIFKMQTENAIIVAPGANQELTITDVPEKYYGSDTVFLVQLEIPFDTVLEVVKKAKNRGATVVLNPAPFHKRTPELFPYIDFLTPNETEFAQVVGTTETSFATQAKLMEEWQKAHAAQLIVTRGAQGIAYTTKSGVQTLPAIAVEVVDSTGAGDTFSGILAAALSQGVPAGDAIQRASIGASLAVTGLGAQTAMPSAATIEARWSQEK